MTEEKENHNVPIYSNIAYDDAFRTMEGNCDDVLISFVNYVFDEKYNNTAVVTRMRNEHFIEHENHSQEKRITDSHFSITQGDVCKKYHLECESKPYDGSILVRLFEYGSQIAIEEAEETNYVLRVKMPHTGLLLLRESKKAPEKATIIIETPGQSSTYYVPIIKETDFTVEMIFEKQLYMLIPFYIFNYEKELDVINQDENRIESMLELYRDINARLLKEQEEGRLSANSISVIIGVTHSVFSKLTSKQTVLNEKVGDYMGGKVLDPPWVIAYNRGKEAGIEQGKEEVIADMLRRGKAVSEIVEFSGYPEDVVKSVEESMRAAKI